MNNELIITVAGQAGAGKSRVSVLLKEFLSAAGFDVDLNLAEGDDENLTNQNLGSVIAELAKTRKITIREMQLAREMRRNVPET